MRHGDRIELGPCTLIFGDARKILPTLADRSVDLVFTDPPYGHRQYDGDLCQKVSVALGTTKVAPPKRAIRNDGPEANQLLADVIPEINRLLRHGGCCCCCCGGGGPDPQFARWSLLLDQHLDFVQAIPWDKTTLGLGWHYRRCYELVLVAKRRGGKMRWFDTTRRVANVIRREDGIKPIRTTRHDHPTAKPPELAAKFIRLHSQPGDVVHDPFMGGGATALAAIREGRRFVGVELDRRWFRLAARRITAELDGTNHQGRKQKAVG